MDSYFQSLPVSAGLNQPLIVLVLLVLGLILCFGATAIFEYHWKRYGKHVEGIFSLRLIYYVGIFSLLAVLIVALVVFNQYV